MDDISNAPAHYIEQLEARIVELEAALREIVEVAKSNTLGVVAIYDMACAALEEKPVRSVTTEDFGP